MVHAGEVVDRRAQPQADGQAADDVARATRNHVDAEHAPARGVEDDLVEPALRADELGAGDRAQWMSHDIDMKSLVGRLGLGQPDPSKLRVGEYRGRQDGVVDRGLDRKSTRLNSSHVSISYAVF